LNLTQRATERLEIGVGQRWQQHHEHQMRDVLDIVLGRPGQTSKRRSFLGATHPGRSFRNDDDTSPCVRKREPGNEWTAIIVHRTTSAFDDETAVRERPRANGGALRPPHRSCERARVRLDVVELGQGTSNRKGELGTRAKSGMGWQ
jgi:hypothetical protein